MGIEKDMQVRDIKSTCDDMSVELCFPDGNKKTAPILSFNIGIGLLEYLQNNDPFVDENGEIYFYDECLIENGGSLIQVNITKTVKIPTIIKVN